MIRDALSGAPAPRRVVDVELSGGLYYGAGAVTLPIGEGFGAVTWPSEFDGAPRVVVVDARNQGELSATITAFKLWFGRGDQTAGTFVRPDALLPNPSLPVRIESGEHAAYMFALDEVRSGAP